MSENRHDFWFADGFDEAIVGYEWEEKAVAYSVPKILEILEEDGMTREEALEYFYYNVEGSEGFGKQIYLWDTILEE